MIKKIKNIQDVVDWGLCVGCGTCFQPLLDRHKWIWGRILGMKLFFIPTTEVKGFYLFKSWRKLPFREKIKTVAGTVKRIILRDLCPKHKIIQAK